MHEIKKTSPLSPPPTPTMSREEKTGLLDVYLDELKGKKQKVITATVDLSEKLKLNDEQFGLMAATIASNLKIPFERIAKLVTAVVADVGDVPPAVQFKVVDGILGKRASSVELEHATSCMAKLKELHAKVKATPGMRQEFSDIDDQGTLADQVTKILNAHLGKVGE